MRNSATQYVTINFSACHSCWQCVSACPQNVLGKVNFLFHKHVHIDHPESCIGCLKCVNACSFKAISKISL